MHPAFQVGVETYINLQLTGKISFKFEYSSGSLLYYGP